MSSLYNTTLYQNNVSNSKNLTICNINSKSLYALHYSLIQIDKLNLLFKSANKLIIQKYSISKLHLQKILMIYNVADKLITFRAKKA